MPDVVIATKLKKVTERIDAQGNVIDPLTHEVVKKVDRGERIGNMIPSEEFDEMARNAGIKKYEGKSQISINGETYIRIN